MIQGKMDGGLRFAFRIGILERRMEKIDLTFVVPVYNAEEYLRDCLDSILRLQKKNIEVICIDDGSGDHSLDICREYAKQDGRVTVIHQDNRGVSAARNAGIERAKGTYISFIDADDFVEEDYEDILEKLMKTRADRCLYRYYRVIEDKKYISPMIFSEGVYEDKAVLFEQIAELMHQVMGAWGGVYRTGLLKEYQIRFPEDMKTCEDFMFSIQTIEHSRKVLISNRAFYNYRLNKSSVTVNRSLVHADNYSIVYDKVKSIMKENSIKEGIASSFQRKWIRWICDLIACLLKAGHSKKTIQEKLEAQKYMLEIATFKKTSFKMKLEWWMLVKRKYQLIKLYLTAIHNLKWKRWES